MKPWLKGFLYRLSLGVALYGAYLIATGYVTIGWLPAPWGTAALQILVGVGVLVAAVVLSTRRARSLEAREGGDRKS